MLREEIKAHFKRLCVAANHTLTRSEYRKINNIPEYSSTKIEGLWGSWKSFVSDVSCTINFNRYTLRKTVKKNVDNIVISSVTDGGHIDFDCFKTLIEYCKEQKCKLYILWGKAINPNAHFSKEEFEVLEGFLTTDLSFERDINCKAFDLLISPTAKNPLQNLDKLSKGLDTIIVGSPKQYLDILPYDPNHAYKIAASTGTLSSPNYKSTISGILDDQNHTLGGLRLSWNKSKNRYDIRQLQYKNGCICDINLKRYKPDTIEDITEVPCVVLGDLHAPETDKIAINDTTKLLQWLTPTQVMVHDWMSYQSINHHDENKSLTKVLTQTEETKTLEIEMTAALSVINDMAKKCKASKFNIIHSNHDDFLLKWLNTGGFVHGEIANRVIGCELFAKLAKNQPLFEDRLEKNIHMLIPGEDVEVCGFQVGKHGDIGIAGARGNPNSYVKTYDKSITGHTHSPKIKESSVVVGTLSKLKLSYNQNSISNWAQANCILYENGSFQLIFI